MTLCTTHGVIVAANATSRTTLRLPVPRERGAIRQAKSTKATGRDWKRGGVGAAHPRTPPAATAQPVPWRSARSHKYTPAVTTNVVKTSVSVSAPKYGSVGYRAVASPAAKAVRSFSTRRAVAYTSRQIAAKTAACAHATGRRPSPIVRLTAATNTG